LGIKLIYEMSVVATALRNEKGQSGLFRYAHELLKALRKRNDLEMLYAHIYYPAYFRNTKHYLQKDKLQEKLCNTPAWPLPRSFFGRAVRYFDKMYTWLDIDVNKVLYDHKMYAEAAVYHSPFTPIPDRVRAFKNLARILTIHDLYALISPLTSEEGRMSMHNLIASIGDDYAICVSENTKADLLSFNNRLHPEKVFVSYLLYHESQLREEYKLKALHQSKKFSWEKCASGHMNMYRQIKSF